MSNIKTINDFKQMLELAKQMDQGNRIFKDLEKPNFLENIEKYLNQSTQKKFNHFTILEIQKNIKQSREIIPFNLNYTNFLHKVYDIYYESKDNLLVKDYKTKYSLLIEYLSSLNFKGTTNHSYNWQSNNIMRFLTMIDGSIYDEVAKDRVIELLTVAKDCKFISHDYYNRMKRIAINVLDYATNNVLHLQLPTN